jgi:hypothetical protein
METLKNEASQRHRMGAWPSPAVGTKGRGRGAVLRRADRGRVNVDNTSFGTIGDDRRRDHSGMEPSRGGLPSPTCSVYTIRDGKIAHVQVYTADQHGVDDFFWKANPLKPIPDRLA